jgi:hypothetical protein
VTVDSPADPATVEEYAQRYKANYRLSGHGLGQARTHLPCPFCGAPDWQTILIGAGLSETPAECSGCHRVARHVVTRYDGGADIELVQVGGPPPPSWLVPAPRRVDGDGGGS